MKEKNHVTPANNIPNVPLLRVEGYTAFGAPIHTNFWGDNRRVIFTESVFFELFYAIQKLRQARKSSLAPLFFEYEKDEALGQYYELTSRQNKEGLREFLESHFLFQTFLKDIKKQAVVEESRAIRWQGFFLIALVLSMHPLYKNTIKPYIPKSAMIQRDTMRAAHHTATMGSYCRSSNCNLGYTSDAILNHLSYMESLTFLWMSLALTVIINTYTNPRCKNAREYSQSIQREIDKLVDMFKEIRNNTTVRESLADPSCLDSIEKDLKPEDPMDFILPGFLRL